MIQMRWLKKQVVTTKHLTDPRGTTHLQTVEILQYRELRKVMNKKLMAELGSSYREEKWTDWMDVPTEIEDIRGKKL